MKVVVLVDLIVVIPGEGLLEWSAGQVVEVPDEKAAQMIANGQAKAEGE